MRRFENLSVVIFTYRAPFGNVPEFIEDEIPYWSRAKKVLVISLAEQEIEHMSMSDNIDAYAVSPSVSTGTKLRHLTRGIKRAGSLNEFLHCYALRSSGGLQRLRSMAVHAAATERYYRGTRELLAGHFAKSRDRVVLYSYWLGPATQAALLLKQDVLGSRAVVITRAHGSDLYEYSNSGGYLPQREKILKSCDRIFPISKHGYNYIRNHWSVPAEKVEVAPLGIPDHFSGCFPKRNGWFSLVSCAYVTPVKRVHLIAEALSDIENRRISWTHLGGGPGFESLKSQCARLLGEKANIRYELVGNISHADVINYFRSRNSNLLVNVSVSEGIPVSMMEAQCSGIPVLGPSVGGIGEIVENDVNGRLLPSDSSAERIREEIVSIVELKACEYERMCKSSRSLWLERFSAEKNYRRLVANVEEFNSRMSF